MKKNNTLILYLVLIFIFIYLFIYFLKAAISLLFLLVLFKITHYLIKKDKRLNKIPFFIKKHKEDHK
jgi:uncharacterized membrane-anchored protein YitT (DUF2179 family)